MIRIDNSVWEIVYLPVIVRVSGELPLFSGLVGPLDGRSLPIRTVVCFRWLKVLLVLVCATSQLGSQIVTASLRVLIMNWIKVLYCFKIRWLNKENIRNNYNYILNISKARLYWNVLSQSLRLVVLFIHVLSNPNSLPSLLYSIYNLRSFFFIFNT